MADVQLAHVTKTFSHDAPAVDDVSLTVTTGEFLVLVGPSGCGKSTILRIIAGLEDATSGTVSIAGRDVTHLSPKERDIAMVFQTYALYPHLNVRDNMMFALKLRGVPRARRDERVRDTVRTLELADLLDRKPKALSGGQRQRVAMGRAIVRDPQVFLMDEPLSNLDAKLRTSMRAELIRLHHLYGATTIYVTHDQVEAMTLGDRIAVLDAGRLQLRQRPDLARYIGGTITVGLRPTAFALPTVPDGPTMTVTVTGFEALGYQSYLLFEGPPDTDDGAGSTAAGTHADEPPKLWTARVDARVTVARGDRVTLGVLLDEAYFFDPASTETIQQVTTPQLVLV